MTVNEVAALTGTVPQNIRKQIARGKLRAIKRGRDWFVDPDEAHRYAREQGRKARTPR
jgi:excisionase family DNA binding protein